MNRFTDLEIVVSLLLSELPKLLIHPLLYGEKTLILNDRRRNLAATCGVGFVVLMSLGRVNNCPS